jgi:hypothetical protein
LAVGLRVSIVITEEAIHPLAALQAAVLRLNLKVNQLVAKPLMAALAMVMDHEVGECTPECRSPNVYEQIEGGLQFIVQIAFDPTGIRQVAPEARDTRQQRHRGSFMRYDLGLKRTLEQGCAAVCHQSSVCYRVPIRHGVRGGSRRTSTGDAPGLMVGELS